MTFVVAFESLTPSPRYDGTSWIGVLIYESDSKDGPWDLIQEITFGDPDTDPTNPKSRNFTVTNATLEAGWYQVSFLDATGALQQPTEPLFNGFLHSYEPNIDQVARKIMSRTRDKYGNMIGTFSNDTSPTNVQAQAIAADTTLEVADLIGDVVPDALIDDATNIAAIRAAMQIELDFYPEQVNSDRSSYNQLKDQYETEVVRVQRAITVANEGDGSVKASGIAMAPSYNFGCDPLHDDRIGLASKPIGFGTRW